MPTYSLTTSPQTVGVSGLSTTMVNRGPGVVSLSHVAIDGRTNTRRLFPNDVIRIRTVGTQTAVADTTASLVVTQDPADAGLAGMLVSGTAQIAYDDLDASVQTGLSSIFGRIQVTRYDIRDPAFGAKCDGVTDDSAAIQAAIDACAAAGGGIVELNAAAAVSVAAQRIVINSSVVLKTGVWLRGSGSTTVLAGTANPMITMPGSGTVPDRVTLSDVFLQSPAGVGVKLSTSGTSGGNQLGWPRVTVDNVTVTDAAGDAFQIVQSGIIEARLVNCVSLRAGGHGFNIGGTDNFLIGCTAAAGTSSSGNGFSIAGGNNKVTACKSYGNAGTGFNVSGAGRHVVSGCESQDNNLYGYATDGNWSTITGCLADSDKLAGFRVAGKQVLSGCSAMYGGGGSGNVTPVGFLFYSTGSSNSGAAVIGGISNCAVPVAGALEGVAVDVQSGSGAQNIAYAATITPDPYAGGTAICLLTGNITVNAPTRYHRGQRLRLILTQDATGGRTVTFASKYKATSVTTTANTTTVVEFVHDGRWWVQVSSSLTSAGSVGIADTFTRTDSTSTLGTSETGSATYTARAGTWGISSNAAYTTATTGPAYATVDAGTADCAITVKVTASLTGNNARPAIYFRWQDSSNYAWWNLRDARVHQVVGGTETSTSIVGAVSTDNDVALLRISGQSWEAYKNGSMIGGGAHTGPLATNHGFGCTNDFGNPSNARFDDFSIS